MIEVASPANILSIFLTSAMVILPGVLSVMLFTCLRIKRQHITVQKY